MRVIAGRFKSRILKDPRSRKTHPMSEKIRGALFNSLGDISELVVLDAFAGTGAVAIEALSRGAIRVYAVDRDQDAFDVLQQNRDAVTDETELSVHRANVKSWLKQQNGLEFDLVIADPPYDAIGMNALDQCAAATKPGGLLIVSLPVAERISFKNCRQIDEKTYGNAKLVYFRKNERR